MQRPKTVYKRFLRFLSLPMSSAADTILTPPLRRPMSREPLLEPIECVICSPALRDELPSSPLKQAACGSFTRTGAPADAVGNPCEQETKVVAVSAWYSQTITSPRLRDDPAQPMTSVMELAELQKHAVLLLDFDKPDCSVDIQLKRWRRRRSCSPRSWAERRKRRMN